MANPNTSNPRTAAMSLVFAEDKSVREAAEQIGVSASTIRRWVKAEREQLSATNGWIHDTISASEDYDQCVEILDGQLAEKCEEFSTFLSNTGSTIRCRYVGCSMVALLDNGALALSSMDYPRAESPGVQVNKLSIPVTDSFYPSRTVDADLKFYYRTKLLHTRYASPVLGPFPDTGTIWSYLKGIIDEGWDFSSSGSTLSRIYFCEESAGEIEVDGAAVKAHLCAVYTIILMNADGSSYAPPFKSTSVSYDSTTLRPGSQSTESVPIARSLAEEMVNECLYRYFDWKIDWIRTGNDEPFFLPRELTRRSAINLFDRRMVIGLLQSGAPSLKGDYFRVAELFEWVSRIAAQSHEGRPLTGELIVLLTNSAPLFELQFKVPVDARDERAVGKLIASGKPGFRPLFKHASVLGMGRAEDRGCGLNATGIESSRLVTWRIPPDDEDFGPHVIKLLGNGRWQWWFNATCVFEVVDGAPRFPVEPIRRDEFKKTLAHCFETYDEAELWQRVYTVSNARTGAIIIIDSNASQVAERIPTGFTADPNRIEPDALKSLSAIDGAVLLNTKAELVGFGMILDGQARAGLGDVSRGARYNSSLRFVHQRRREGASAVALVCSDDGMVNCLRATMSDYLPRYTGNSVAHGTRIELSSTPDDLAVKLTNDQLSTLGQISTISRETFCEYYSEESVNMIQDLLDEHNLTFLIPEEDTERLVENTSKRGL